MAKREHDVIYYWTGDTEYGQWNEAWEATDEKYEEFRGMGYFTIWGKRSIGAPEGSPFKQ